MVKNIVKGKKIFKKAKPATEADKQIVTDLMDTAACQQRNLCRYGGKYDWQE